MPPPRAEKSIPEALHSRPLDRVLREVFGLSWAEARGAIRSGKVFVGARPEELSCWTEEQRPVPKGGTIAIRPEAPRPKVQRRDAFEDARLLFLDGAVVVVDKPAGMSTIPFGDEPEDGTLAALLRDVLKTKLRGRARGMAPLGVVHRLDKDTSGAIVFARTVEAKKALADQFRSHSITRRYLAVVHGLISAPRTIRSHLVADRGDGIRGSARHKSQGGQLAITHVEPLELLGNATLVACRLETGRTHQIRVHLAEAGHPIVGERVYMRGYRGQRLDAPRQMLHAAQLGFEHPVEGEPMDFEAPLPPDFEQLLARLRTR